MPALEPVMELLGSLNVRGGFYAALVLLLGLLVGRIASRRLPLGSLHPQYQQMLRRGLRYSIWVVALMWALQLLGVSLGVLLGAAGIFTVAIGFAAQTSVSNVISGLFLMGEQPFRVGDVVRIGDVTGEVLSVDLLSVRLRTFDNLMVRIPNESMLKSNVVNLTQFPIRRIDLMIGVAYKEDLREVITLLKGVADLHPECLEEPEPIVMCLGYADSSVSLQFSVWCAKDRLVAVRTDLYIRIKECFDAHGIEIPFPQRTLHVRGPVSTLAA